MGAGLLLLPAGWMIVLAAVAMLPAPVSRNVFVLAGAAIELLGLILIGRSQKKLRRNHK